ncbi:MAG: hypothetical protein ACK5L6_08925 [Anaerorhabdus sp.]|uniref:hypothetical protein n=1 Tax=Anaerorhabdus sp. TaxID=1872524 RepID=UPI003A8495A7
MKKKFAFIGAGSLDFTRDLIRDLLTFKSFEDCEILALPTWWWIRVKVHSFYRLKIEGQKGRLFALFFVLYI